MTERKWKTPKVTLPQSEDSEFRGSKLFYEPYSYPRMVCTECLTERWSPLMIGGLCRTCIDKKMDEVAKEIECSTI